LTQRLTAIGALAFGYLALTLAVAIGAEDRLDREVANSFAGLWNDQLHILFQGIAELGGLELTSILAVALVVYLLRNGFGSDAWALLAFPIAIVIETLYKALLAHPGPPLSMKHSDGPSVTDVFSKVVSNSFPSGHMVRAVVIYGLIAFVVGRLAPWRGVRVGVAVVAVVLVALLALDRLYLEAHWASDVIGGVLLGGIMLLGATVWLDRPLKEK
jgi:membrane-associated phospholipid phosphatase